MTYDSVIKAILAENRPVTVTGSKRIQALDALKLLSLIGVLCLHCAESYYFHTQMNSLWSVTRFVYCMGVLAIPMFFTVSGYQLLGRTNSDYRYAFRKVFALLKVAFLLYLLVLLLSWILFGNRIVVTGIPRQFVLNLVQRGDYSILWFVGGLCLVYLAYPVINNVYNRDKKLFLWLGLVCMVVMSGVFFVSVVRPIEGVPREMEIWQTFRLWNWIGYFCIGGLIKRYRIFKVFGKMPIIFVMAAVCFVFLNMIVLKRGVWYCEYGYASLPVILFVVSVFTYFIKQKFENRFLVEMAFVFMPAYMLGPVCQNMVESYAFALPETLGAILWVVMNAVLSIAFGWLLMKIPGVRRLLKL